MRPDHPAIVAAIAAGVPVRSEIDVAVERLRARTPPPRLVAVTGTNGKTTVTTMIAAMCAEAGLRSTAVGNIGRPIIEATEDVADVVVAEVSTFQLEFTTDAFVPDIAVLLNVAQDHIDWHDTVENYAAAKARVFAHQGPGDVLVVSRDDPVAWGLAQSARRTGRSVHARYAAARWVRRRRRHARRAAGRARAGAHDGCRPRRRQRACRRRRVAARRCRRACGGAHARDLDRSAAPGAASWAIVDGVQYVDDSKATNGHAAASALEGFEHVVLIAGGRDRSRDLGLLQQFAPRLRAVVAIGEATDTVVALFDGLVPVERATSMHGAVRSAAARAQTGDTVLLSPGCASLDWYENYAARGDDFAREVEILAGERSRTSS